MGGQPFLVLVLLHVLLLLCLLGSASQSLSLAQVQPRGKVTESDLSFNSLTGGIPDSVLNLDLSKMILTGNKLNGAIPNEINGVQYKADLSYNNFTFPDPTLKQIFTSEILSLPFFLFRGLVCILLLLQPVNQRIDHSLFINAGSETTIFEGNHYDADDSNSSFDVSPRNWAYSCTGDFLSSTTNFSDYFKELPCGVNVSKAPLYAKPRLCPQSLTYYGFCLRNGNYTVKLHFAENIYARDGDHSSTGKRRNQVLRDFNIKEKAKGPNKIWIETFTANVQDNLLEIRLFWAGKGSLYNPPLLNGPLISAISVTPEFKVGGLSHTKIAGIAAASIFIPLLLLAFMWRMGWLGHKEFQETLELRGKTYTVKQVIDATRKFSHKMEIGRGRFGILYKVKLVRLNFKFFFFLKNLEKHSFSLGWGDLSSDLELNWDTRFNIFLGIAKGIKCLHEDSRLKIVHRNVKPSNILLDGELKAKISDFGLAKIYEEETPNVVIGAGDTLSYMAPEYATAKVVTEKADVYSFRIVLLEVVSGKKNADHRPNQESVYLIDDGKLVNLIDDKLQTYDRDQALDILNIAILCIDRSPTLRPTMSEVVSVLEGNKKIEELFKPATPST
ncbi:hypothetical protein JRO89_XS04G0283800 [Xanthoceras sorbifolium]|uniref:non-specific serine/threonine protein kinase n=1 Tax=Xanthoceras sorbifolium TaxID=99658 RepID=A0ABQ8I7V9_9ROSI|nr:hypothetical protein JRO89_XS04G0283800 [Xanthoceras sorbifolium]